MPILITRPAGLEKSAPEPSPLITAGCSLRSLGRAHLLFAFGFLLLTPFAVLLACTSASAAPSSTTLRPPAVPLVTHDPYFSIWSPADRLTDIPTTHWTGKPHPLHCLIRVDGKLFRLLSTQPSDAAPLPQTDLQVLPTRTICRFANQQVRVTLTFLTPALPSDLEVLARPVTYVTWEIDSADGHPTAVQLYFDCGAEIAVNTRDQQVIWNRPSIEGLATLRIGSKDQPALAKRGDDLRIDWGYGCLAATLEQKPHLAIGDGEAIRAKFAAGGTLPEQDDTRQPRAVADSSPAMAAAFDLGQVAASPVSRYVMLAYDDEYSIRYFRAKLRPYWRRNGAGIAELLRAAARDYPALAERCRLFDTELVGDLARLGGEKYALLCALAYRQTFAGNKIVADANDQPLMFPKENFSNGCIGTVDVLFPQAPFFLVFSPALVKAMLVPILDYASSPRWPHLYAPHDLGIYPHATGQVYGIDGGDGARMPVEESGNMLIMMAALARIEGQADLARTYWALLTRWADYLVHEGLDPANQLCSADMFGHLPHVANLALKAILAIGGYAQLCAMAGQPDDANKYMAIARDYAVRWQELAKDKDHTRLAYHLPGTWGMKHNLIWDRVLGLNLLPQSVGDAEIAWYLKVQNQYGLPVDNRTDTSLIDWAMWSIAPARHDADFQALLDPLFRYANQTHSRVPLSDWFNTTNAYKKGFQARPVVGGIFIKMLADQPTWVKWATRSPKIGGPWAPVPIHASQTWGGQSIDVGLVEDNPLAGLRKLFDTPLRDTSICRGPDGTWYLTGTIQPFWAYNEGIHLWKSKDLVRWESLGLVWRYGDSLRHKPYRDAKKPLWAPEVHYLQNTFFKDEQGRWWSTFFGSDSKAPWQERPGLLPVQFDPDGRVGSQLQRAR
jgi:hypothetical protein